MKLLIHNDWKALEDLRGVWDQLLDESSTKSFFLTWTWLESWWKNYGGDKQLHVLTAWDGEALAAVAPFCLDLVRHQGRTWRRLQFIGDGSDDSDYLDCFARPAREADAAQAILDYLHSQRHLWDYLELHGPTASSPMLRALIDGATQRGWCSSTEDVPCLKLDLPGNWNDYLQSLKPRLRTKLRSSMAFFEQQVKAKPIECTTEEQLREWLPLFFDLHAKRWNAKGKAGVFHGKEKRDFYFEISRSALKAGTLDFHRIDWGERPLAFQYGFRYQNCFYLLQEAYDPDFESLRPGLALRGMRFREMIASGIREYDFLAGTAPHKLDWGAIPKLAVKTRIVPSPAAALILIKAPQFREGVKESLRKITPEPVLALRRKLKSKPLEPSDLAISPRENKWKSLIAGLYASSPFRYFGRWITNSYQLGTSNGLQTFSIEKRTAPICQIFLYHRINDDGDPFLPALPVHEFRKQMEYVAKNFSIVSLDDIAEGRIGSDNSKYCVAITFDDGYRDNFTYAFPILKELGIPATIYLATGHIGTNQLPWYDQVCLAFKLSVRPFLRLRLAGAPEGPLQSKQSRLSLLEQVLDWLRELDDETWQKAMRELFEVLGVPSSLSLPNYMLNWDEVRQMKNHKISFGAHTVTHPVLSRLTGARLRDEITRSKNTIEQKIQTEVRHFAYPFGRPIHFSDEAKHVIEQSGFKTAVTTVYGFNKPGDDPFALKRLTPWGRSKASFALQLDWQRFAGV